MRIEARLRGVHRLMQISLQGERYRGRVGDWEVDAEIIEEGNGALTVRTGGRTFDITYWRDGRETYLDLGGTAISVEILDPLRPSHGGNGDGVGSGKREIRAAMPGKVVAVKARPGEAVRQGQGVIVVEAMKMENEVPSPKSGRVMALAVVPGQTVEKGALLFSIE
jgi:acetyl/propionyl-CoA carboxylase alpha subunit